MVVRLGFLSTYPDTRCDVAMFTESLVAHLAAAGAEVGLVRPTGRRGRAATAAAALDGYDVAVVQHQDGIDGDRDGQDVLDVVGRLRVPVLTVLHAVPPGPGADQHRVLAELVTRSVALVTLTSAARDRLVAGWGVDPARVAVVGRGVEDNRSLFAPLPNAQTRQRTVLTWGPLREGKGIEWALLGLAELRRRRVPLPTYVVVGQPDPLASERDGADYRDRLLALTRDLRLTGNVRFDGRRLAPDDLRELVRRADVVLLPYDSLQQVTSQVLTEAVAAGKPVVSTSFPYAVELLSMGAGMLVPGRDPTAIADALERMLTIHGLADLMASKTRHLAESLLWPAVAARYLELVSSVRRVPADATV